MVFAQVWPTLADSGRRGHHSAPSEHPFSLQHAPLRLALASNMLIERPPSLRKRPPSRFCCLLDRCFEDFREPGTSKTMLKPANYQEFHIFSTFASEASSELAKAPQSLPETPPKHPKTLQRAPLELPETSPRHPQAPQKLLETPLEHSEMPPQGLKTTAERPWERKREKMHAQNMLQHARNMLNTCFSVL